MSRRDEIKALQARVEHARKEASRARDAFDLAREELSAALRAERAAILQAAPQAGDGLVVVRLTITRILTVASDSPYNEERAWRRRDTWQRGQAFHGRGSIDVVALEAAHPEIMAQERWTLPGWAEFLALASS